MLGIESERIIGHGALTPGISLLFINKPPFTYYTTLNTRSGTNSDFPTYVWRHILYA